MRKGQNRDYGKTIEAFRRQGGGETVVTDAWNPGTGENKVPDEELLPGEIAAVTFQVGSYTVRSALRPTHEVSARHASAPDGAFTYICRAADPMNGRWFEYIGDIYAVKETEDIPDECASLLVYFVFTSDFYGVDTWYRFGPDGEITKYVSDLLDLDGSKKGSV